MTGRSEGPGRARAALHAALALLLLPAPPASAAPRPTGQQAQAPQPDFSQVTTRTAASRLARKHQLVKIHVFPTELGGPDIKPNIVYVTPEAAAAHAQLTEMLSRYVERDLVDHLEIEPDYRGLSIVPTRIRFKATHSHGGESFERVIGVWGGVWSAPEPLSEPDVV
jgi:hypothetical protein